MLPRERIIENERLILSEFACKSGESRGRREYENPCDFRTDFQRDRDRIIHCNSFRRLKHKTQVFLIPHGDHYRTRLTHTLEVSQIARTVSCALGLNEDLTEAIALGHDLGHTPFGHDGERVLNKLLPGGFAHNLQSKRVVEVIEKDGRGLNLTFEVIDGIVGHRGRSALPVTREGQVVRLCDKIAYINHDIEDAIRGGVITQRDLPKYPVEFLGDTKSKRITSLVRSLVENSGENVRFDEETDKAFAELRNYMFEYVYTAEPTIAEKDKAGHIIEYLFGYFYKNKDEMPPLYRNIAERDGIETAVGDFISGMTDEYAVGRFSDLCIPKGWNR
ncbi:MAG: deoxyguanosinetriphosphate triphosphohydrolase [Oscillospiraceae bacterium]|nr:deoxyguanosinetriphosphate triphosphohydrolase [Oscillospiraceae bacterium]